MLASARKRIAETLPEEALVLDVGGWGSPLARADWVLDLLPHESRGLYGYDDAERAAERFTAETWVQRDVCASAPWPFGDCMFDFAVCAHTLEDVRDPVRVCEELVRVARAGYVEVPAPVEELTFGIHGPWVGWTHHRWITEREGDGLVFTNKPHLLAAPGRHLPRGTCDRLAPEQRVIALWWQAELPARERVIGSAEELDSWLDGLLAANHY